MRLAMRVGQAARDPDPLSRSDQLVADVVGDCDEGLATTDPARATQRLGRVDAYRGSWVPPQDVDDLAAHREQLATTLADDLAAGCPHLRTWQPRRCPPPASAGLAR